jgi:HK97 family phage major capsid protein/HK97 family phage prohead protease
MNQRAWSTLTIKSVDDEQRTIEGIASTPEVDRMGDIVEPKGAEFNLPIPLLWQHNHDEPIGTVLSAKVTDAGIQIKAQIGKGVLPRIDEAWALIKSGLVRGLSIGFQPLESEPIKGSYGQRFTKWSWLELSAVTIPANAGASILAIKQADTGSRAASGQERGDVVRLSSLPGATGNQLVTRKGKAMATFNEQIASFEAKRAADVARMDELLAEASKEGCTLDKAQQEEHDNLEVEVKSIDGHLTRLRAAVERMKSTAKPVTPEAGTNPEAAVKIRAGEGVLRVNSNLPKGRTFTRYAMTLLRSKGDSYKALELAKQYNDSTPEVEQMVKAAVAAGNTTDSGWALPLAVTQPTNEFVELLYPMTILGKLNGVQRVPFNVSMPRQTAGSVSQWVGEDNPKPVSKLTLETISLGRSKIATIVVLSEELVQDSSPSAEAVVQADMLKSVAAYSDSQFIDPTVTASGTVRPASITNGLTTHNMTGTAVSNVLTDMQTLMSGYITANIPFDGAAWVMHPRTALYLSMLLSSLGTPQFPNITVAGGTFLGFPVITSTSVPIDTGADTYIILMDAGSVLLADDGIKIDVSREASLQMDSAPTDAAASSVSLWQNNLVGLRCERRICYRRRRDAAVQVLSAVSY